MTKYTARQARVLIHRQFSKVGKLASLPQELYGGRRRCRRPDLRIPTERVQRDEVGNRPALDEPARRRRLFQCSKQAIDGTEVEITIPPLQKFHRIVTVIFNLLHEVGIKW